MNSVLRYFRLHPWQRRAVTFSVAALAGVGVALAVWPVLRERRVMRALAGNDAAVRERAIPEAVALAAEQPGFIRRLERRLDAADDLEFSTLVEVLTRLGRFGRTWRSGEQLDRYAAISLQTAQLESVRLLLLYDLLTGGRDNEHVRRALQQAVGDESPRVRGASATLAARLGDDAALRGLLGDGEAEVRASAALAAGLADRRDCREAAAALLARGATDAESSAAALALWRWGQGGSKADASALETSPAHVPDLALSADSAGEAVRRDLLLNVLLWPSGQSAQRRAAESAVVGVLARAGQRKRIPPAMAFVAGGRMGLPETGPFIREAIDSALPRKTALTGEELEALAAAVQASRRLKTADPARATALMDELWHQRTSLLMILSAEAVGDALAAAATTAPGAPSSAPATAPAGASVALEALRKAVQFPDTPVPSAAAAVAWFRIEPRSGTEAVGWACDSDVLLAGDYVAWELSRLAGEGEGAGLPPAVRQLGEALLAGPAHSVGTRSAGGMLLALTDRGTDRAPATAGRIEDKLRGPGPGAPGVRSPLLAGSYRCALLALGQERHAAEVQVLAESDGFPAGRALTALLLADPARALDRILGGAEFDFGRTDALLTGLLLARVLERYAPFLPACDLDAPAHVRAFQQRVLRDFYLIHRRDVLDRMNRQ